MSPRQIKALANAIGASPTIPIDDRKGVAIDIANALLWTGRYRKQFLVLVDKEIEKDSVAPHIFVAPGKNSLPEFCAVCGWPKSHPMHGKEVGP